MEKSERVVREMTQIQKEKEKIPIEEMPKLRKRYERDHEEFAIWLDKMLILTETSGSQLSKEIFIDAGYISRLRNGKQYPSKNVERLIVAYFERIGAIVYENESSAYDKNQAFCRWLNDQIRMHGITKRQIAVSIGESESGVLKILQGYIKGKYIVKYHILEYLEEKYKLDVSKGRELLEDYISKTEKFSAWLSLEISKLGISEEQLAKELNYKIKTVRLILNSARMPSKYATYKIMEILKSYGSKVTQEELIAFHDADAKFKKFGDWLTSVMHEKQITNIELAEKIDKYTSTISYYRNGRYLPTEMVLNKIFEALNSEGIDTEEGLRIWKQLKNSNN